MSRRARGSPRGCSASAAVCRRVERRRPARRRPPGARVGQRPRRGGARHPTRRRPIPSTRTRTCCSSARSRRPETRSRSNVSSNASLDLFRQRARDRRRDRSCTEAARIETTPRRRAESAAGRASMQALVESGEAPRCTRAHRRRARRPADRAVAEPAMPTTPTLEAATLLALGSALVHAAKGRDEEGSAALHRAIAAAEASGDRRIAAAAHRELGYVELLRGDYRARAVWLRTAASSPTATRSSSRGSARSMARRRQRRRTARPGRPSPRRRDRAGRSVGATDGRRRGRWRASDGPNCSATSSDAAEDDAQRSTRPRPRAERWTAFLPYPRSAAGRGVGPPGTTGPGHGERSSMRSRWPARSTTRAGRPTRCAGSGCSGRPAATSTGSIDADGGRPDPMPAPARHAPMAPRVRDGRALCGRDGGRASPRRGVGHRPGVAGRHARGCASSPSARTCTGASSATRTAWTRRARWRWRSRTTTSTT